MSLKLQKYLSWLTIAAALFITRSEHFGVATAPTSAGHGAPVVTASR